MCSHLENDAEVSGRQTDQWIKQSGDVSKTSTPPDILQVSGTTQTITSQHKEVLNETVIQSHFSFLLPWLCEQERDDILLKLLSVRSDLIPTQSPQSNTIAAIICQCPIHPLSIHLVILKGALSKQH